MCNVYVIEENVMYRCVFSLFEKYWVIYVWCFSRMTIKYIGIKVKYTNGASSKQGKWKETQWNWEKKKER